MHSITSEKVQPFELGHLTALRALAPECMVLLKKNGDFPLTAPCPVALYGSGARQTIKGGTGSGDVNVRHFTTVEEGLENAGFTIADKAWLDCYDRLKVEAKKQFYQDILTQAQKAGVSPFLYGMGKMPPEPAYDMPLNSACEVCIYVLARNSGEGADRKLTEGDYLLTQDEVRDILACASKYPKFLLALNVGGPVDLSPVMDHAANILLLGQLGSVTGDAFADVLLGKACPSGKLTTTWMKAVDLSAAESFSGRDDTRYREGIFVGYRHDDTVPAKPLFSFGYGLSFSDFSIVQKDFRVQNCEAVISVTVKNIGHYAGKETVQLYYAAPEGKLKKPLRELGAYVKTKQLQPGESETVILSLPLEDMASWDSERDCWLLETGDYVLLIGDIPVGIVALSADVQTASGGHCGGEADFRDEEPAAKRVVPQGLPRVEVQAEALHDIGHFDRARMTPSALDMPDVSSMTDRELAICCVGRHSEVTGLAAIIGNSAAAVAGGAGETADWIQEHGYGKLITADGPAGLRLATKYINTDAGAESIDSAAFSDMMPIFPEQVRQMIETKLALNEEKAKTSTVCYHYASAIPIGTALAQAWNPEVAEICADIVGDEMERFGVNVWLAPAMNIHRSPLCGRNFEYYSEDPLLSGKTAAAITKGIQKHPNCAVTIKHFACNNQETNRFGSNSIVSQRALREIYLKGFEICVKEAAPMALMTSYNLLNGVHTANRDDLLHDILRNEWGFTGIVMTDWGTTNESFNKGKHGASSPALCIKAGNDLIMSGEKKDVEGILEGLKNGEITRGDLEACAGRILAMAKRFSR